MFYSQTRDYEEEGMIMRNFIFISPHFPTNYENFCVQLHENGVNVFGIGDTPYENLTDSLKTALTEYYKVDSMEDYDQMYRAVAFLCYKHGSMDGLESNNEYWLEQDARLRTDFNIPGMKTADMEHVKYKSKMKPYYATAGIPTARYHLVTDLTESLAFVEKVGYPVIVKPDNGVGATTTYKLKSEDELRAFHEEDFHGVQFIMEEFVPGEIYSYDAIMNSKGEPIFETGNHTPISIMDSVNNHDDSVFYIEKHIADDVRAAGRAAVKSFGVKSRFVHFEFFRLTEDHDYLGKKGKIIGLEVNYRPSGGFTPDMINYACSTDVYKDWADMVAFDRLTKEEYPDKYYCVSAGCRKEKHYLHSYEEVMAAYKDDIMMTTELPEVLASAMGDRLYLARFAEKEAMDAFISYVFATA
ncbi:MAG: ATP-grasp domain-containing protein [Coprococcus catus]|jgi:biotin carboxylase|uniref:ATP-grasp domain-containing protein n=1 Tax=Coprococcus intestinihominis TaxID=3133154 RepID=A0ABV1B9B5_9FIRM|nr:ATP-grasp domain-containing protein [Coprococcus catus]